MTDPFRIVRETRVSPQGHLRKTGKDGQLLDDQNVTFLTVAAVRERLGMAEPTARAWMKDHGATDRWASGDTKLRPRWVIHDRLLPPATDERSSSSKAEPVPQSEKSMPPSVIENVRQELEAYLRAAEAQQRTTRDLILSAFERLRNGSTS